jgi:hypothetical protein
MELVVRPKPPGCPMHYLLDFGGEVLALHADCFSDWLDKEEQKEDILAVLNRGEAITLEVKRHK